MYSTVNLQEHLTGKMWELVQVKAYLNESVKNAEQLHHMHCDKLLTDKSESKTQADQYGDELLIMHGCRQCAVDYVDAAEATCFYLQGPCGQ